MEIEGHPTVDLIAELEARGATRLPGTAAGPEPSTPPGTPDEAGFWLFLPGRVFATGLDDVPE